MIDPTSRWRALGLPDKPDSAGLLTYSGLPYTEDQADLAGVDAAIVGAPMDDLVSDRPGTRFGPRAIRAASCPPGPHLEAGVDWSAELRVVDYGDAPVLPADAPRTHAGIEALVAEVSRAGAIPIVLGGDHSIAEPDVKGVASVHGPVALVHFDTHTDTGEEVFDVEFSHGTPMYRLVRDGHVDPRRYVQIGLRTRNGDARAGRDDQRRSPVGGADARGRARPGGHGRRRGDPERRRLGRRHRARRRARGARDADRDRDAAANRVGARLSTSVARLRSGNTRARCDRRSPCCRSCRGASSGSR